MMFEDFFRVNPELKISTLAIELKNRYGVKN